MQLTSWRGIVVMGLGFALALGGLEAVATGGPFLGTMAVVAGCVAVYGGFRMIKRDDRPEEIKRGFD